MTSSVLGVIALLTTIAGALLSNAIVVALGLLGLLLFAVLRFPVVGELIQLAGPPRPPGGLNDPQLASEEAKLREYLSIEASEKRLEKYSTWLFGLTTILIALGATGFVTDTFKPEGKGVLTWAAAIVFAGLSFAFGAVSLVPTWAQHDRSLPSMERATQEHLKRRVRNYKFAGACSGAALILAGVTPLFTALFPTRDSFFWEERQGPVVDYTIAESGTMSVVVKADRLKHWSPLRAWAIGTDEAAEEACLAYPGPPDLPVATPTPTPTSSPVTTPDASSSPSLTTSAVFSARRMLVQSMYEPITAAEPFASAGPTATPAPTPPPASAAPSGSPKASATASAMPSAPEVDGPPLFLPAVQSSANVAGHAEVALKIHDVWQLTREPRICVVWFPDWAPNEAWRTEQTVGPWVGGANAAIFDLPLVVRPVPTPAPPSPPS